MPNPVVVEFMLKGMPEIARAIRSVQQAAEASDKSRSAAASRGSSARTRVEEQEAKMRIRAMLKADAEVARIQNKAIRDTEKASKAKAREADKLANEEMRAAEKTANMKLRVARTVDREIQQIEKRRERENARIMREGLRLEEQKHREQTRMLKERDRAEERFRRGTGSAVTTGLRKGVSRVAGGIARGAGMLAELGGGFSIVDSVKGSAELEKSAVRFSNSAFLGKGERLDPKALIASAKASSVLTGIDPNEMMQGAHAFLAKTGNAKEAVANMQTFGEIATGTGANIEDVAKAAGTLRIQNEGLKPEEMRSILLQTVRQGQKGSIEFSDLAGSVGKITRTSSGYAGNQGKTQAELLGIAQLGMSTMSDPRDVATSLAGIESDTKKNWKKMQGVLGPDTFDEMGRITKGPAEFTASVMEKSGGDTRKLQEMGFNKQAMKFFQALAPTFQDAGGGKKGKEALLTKMKDIVAEPMGDKELKDNVKNILNTSAMQFETSMMQLKTSVGEQLLPEFIKLVPVLREMIPTVKMLLEKFLSIANWAAANPFSGIASVLALSIGAEVAKAQLAKTLETALATSLGQKGSLTVASAAIAVTAAMIAVEKISDDDVRKTKGEVEKSNRVFSDAMGVRVGDATSAAELRQKKILRDQYAAEVAEQRKNVNTKETGEYLGTAGRVAGWTPAGFIAQKVTGTNFEDMSTDRQKQREDRLAQSERSLKAMNDAIDITVLNLAKLGQAANSATPVQGGTGVNSAARDKGVVTRSIKQ